MSGPSGFLTKTFEIFSTPEYADLCGWGANGDTIYVRKIEEFSKQILPKYFKHANFQSFVRQLNMYDFHKTVQDPNNGEFHHMYFRKDRPELMSLIKRKANSRTESSKKTKSTSGMTLTATSVKAEGEADSVPEETPAEDIVHFPMDQQEPCRSEEHDLERRVMELEYASNRLSEIENQYARIVGENQMLKRMVVDARAKQEATQEKVENILKILKSLYVTVHGGEVGSDGVSLGLEDKDVDRTVEERHLIESIIPALTSLSSAKADFTDAAAATGAASLPVQVSADSRQSTVTKSRNRGSSGGSRARERPPLRRPPAQTQSVIDEPVAERVEDALLLSHQNSFDMAASSVFFSDPSLSMVSNPNMKLSAPSNSSSNDAVGSTADVDVTTKIEESERRGEDLGAPLVRLGSSLDSFLSYLGNTADSPGAILAGGGAGGSSYIEPEVVRVKEEVDDWSSVTAGAGEGGGLLVRQSAYDTYEPLAGTTNSHATRSTTKKSGSIHPPKSKNAVLGKRKLRGGSAGDGGKLTDEAALVTEDADETSAETADKGPHFSEPSEGFSSIIETQGIALTRLDSLESTLSSLLDLCGDEPPMTGLATSSDSILGMPLERQSSPGLQRLASGLERLSSILSPTISNGRPITPETFASMDSINDMKLCPN